MAGFVQHWVVVIDGQSHDIVTNAHDQAGLPVASQTMGDIYAMLHHCCVRLHVEGCPQDYDRFLDVLQDADPVNADNGNGVGAAVDPTPETVSAG